MSAAYARPPPRRERAVPWLAGGLIMLAAGLAWETQYFVDPEVTLLPWLISRGWVLYRDLVDQHPPLFPVLLAGLGGGDPGLPLRLVILGLRVGTLALTYRVARRWAGPGAGLAALALAEAWLVPFEGTHLWYDGALGPIYLGVLWLVGGQGADGSDQVGPRHDFPRWWQRGGRALAVGLLLGCGCLIKQHAAVAVPFVAFALYAPRREAGLRFAWFAVGLAGPLLGAGAVLGLAGALDAAWTWVVAYNLGGSYAALAALAPASSEWPVLAALYAPLAAFGLACLLRRGAGVPAGWGQALGLLGLLLAATLPAWPRYGRFHFQAALPLLAVAGGLAGVTLAAAWRDAGHLGKVGAALGLLLVGVGLGAGAGHWLQAGTSQRAVLGPPQPPYAATVAPLRAWVDAHAAPAAPIFIYGLDALLYRVLEREPPRPWAPVLLPWIRAAGDTEARFWAGVDRARPAVVLVPAAGWDSGTAPGPDGQAATLRRDYQPAARFAVVSYAPAPPVGVVGLLRAAK